MHHPLTLPTQSSPKIEITEGQGLFPQLSDIVTYPEALSSEALVLYDTGLDCLASVHQIATGTLK